jgi:hypothetical protein
MQQELFVYNVIGMLHEEKRDVKMKESALAINE